MVSIRRSGLPNLWLTKNTIYGPINLYSWRKQLFFHLVSMVNISMNIVMCGGTWHPKSILLVFVIFERKKNIYFQKIHAMTKYKLL